MLVPNPCWRHAGRSRYLAELGYHPQTASGSIQTFLTLLAVPQDLVDRCQQSVQEHCTFSHRLSELQQWTTLVTQTLESHQGDVSLWDTETQETGPEVKCWFISLPTFS